MRIFAAACIALGLIVVAGRTGGAAESGTRLVAGDQLTYQITVELQQHHTTSGAQTKDKAVESAAEGSETFTIYSIGPDGTALANVDASFQGTDKGKPFESHSATAAKVLPDGRLLVKSQFGLGISDALGFANTTILEFRAHPLVVGTGWTSPQDTPYVRLMLVRKVAGMTTYQGFSAYEVQTLGSGNLLKTTDGKPAAGTVAVSGTSYYDQADHLFLGEALRTLTVVEQPGSTLTHDNYSATLDVVLSSWTHASPVPAATGSQGPEPTPTIEPTPVAPPPPMFGPTPYPTVTPRLGS